MEETLGRYHMHHTIKDTAANLLKSRGGTYRRLAHIHSGVTIGAWLVLFIASYLVQYLSPEGGLSNMDTYALIFTAQVVLILLGLILTPFWETGLSYVALDFVRDRRNLTGDLAEGFRCLKPLGGALVFQGVQYALAYLISNSVTVFLLTLLPLPQSFYSDATALLKEPSSPLEGRMLLVAAVYAAVFLIALAFLVSQIFYRYRMTRYLILDDVNAKGVGASLAGMKLMKRNKRKLLKLDLSFWWFYIPEFLGFILPVAVLLLSALQVPLSPRTQTLCWAIAGGCLLLRLVVHLIGKPKLAASYALFYERLLKQEEEPIVEDAPKKSPPPKPQKPTRPPWNY